MFHYKSLLRLDRFSIFSIQIYCANLDFCVVFTITSILFWYFFKFQVTWISFRMLFFVYFHVKNLEKFNILDLGSIWQFRVENVLNRPSAKERKWSTTLFVLKNTDFTTKRCIYRLCSMKSAKFQVQLSAWQEGFRALFFNLICRKGIIYSWFFNKNH